MNYEISSNESTRIYLANTVTIMRANNNLVYYVCVSKDISNTFKLKEEYYKANYLDPLTHYPNQKIFVESLDRQVKKAKEVHQKLAIILLDIEKVGEINTYYGISMGDYVIKEVGRRIKEEIYNHQTLFKYSGSVFAILQQNVIEEKEIEQFLLKIHQVIERPISIQGRKIYIGLNIGVALYPNDGASTSKLIEMAQVALIYAKKQKKSSGACIYYSRALQEELDLDVLVHGEYERNDMVEYFGENLSGYIFTEKAWVQSYGTRCVKPPIIFGDIKREKPITVETSVYANRLTTKEVKGMLTGPITILNWSFPREDVSLKDMAMQIGLAIRDEVLDLEKNGIRVIQIDEAALKEKLPIRKADWYSDYLEWAIPAFRLTHSKVKPETQIHTHMCYSEFGEIVKDIDAMDADVITIEASRSDLEILDALRMNHFETEVGPGVYDIHSPRVPSVEEIERIIYRLIDKCALEKLWVNPDCGLKTRGEKETKASLKNLVEATKRVRATL